MISSPALAYLRYLEKRFFSSRIETCIVLPHMRFRSWLLRGVPESVLAQGRVLRGFFALLCGYLPRVALGVLASTDRFQPMQSGVFPLSH